MEAPPPHAQRLLQEIRQHPEMTNRELAEVCGMTRGNVHGWKRTFSKAGLIVCKSGVASADSTTDNRRA